METLFLRDLRSTSNYFFLASEEQIQFCTCARESGQTHGTPCLQLFGIRRYFWNKGGVSLERNTKEAWKVLVEWEKPWSGTSPVVKAPLHGHDVWPGSGSMGQPTRPPVLECLAPRGCFHQSLFIDRVWWAAVTYMRLESPHQLRGEKWGDLHSSSRGRWPATPSGCTCVQMGGCAHNSVSMCGIRALCDWTWKCISKVVGIY